MSQDSNQRPGQGQGQRPNGAMSGQHPGARGSTQSLAAVFLISGHVRLGPAGAMSQGSSQRPGQGQGHVATSNPAGVCHDGTPELGAAPGPSSLRPRFQFPASSSLLEFPTSSSLLPCPCLQFPDAGPYPLRLPFVSTRSRLCLLQSYTPSTRRKPSRGRRHGGVALISIPAPASCTRSPPLPPTLLLDRVYTPARSRSTDF